MHDLFDSMDEKGLRSIAVLHSFECRDEKPLTDAELMEGRLATALHLFDVLLGNCGKGNCPELPHHWCDFLDDLSVARCVEMKAYHRWRLKNKPFQADAASRQEDYIAACRDIWVFPTCKKKIDHHLCLTFEAYYKNRREATTNKKAFWQSEASPESSISNHFNEACSYVDAFYSLLYCKLQPRGELTDFVKRNASMMSVLEFLFVGCQGLLEV